MMNPPKTKAEAKAYVYGTWSGNQSGHRFDPNTCAYEVFLGGWIPGQCTRNPGHGPDALYCKQHAKKVPQ